MPDKTLQIYNRSNDAFRTPYFDNGDGSYSQHVISGGKLTVVSLEFTRENNATPYGIGDVISGSAASPLVYELPDVTRNLGGSGTIVSLSVAFNVKPTTPPVLRIHFFNASNPTVSGDNLPHQEKYADCSKRLRYVDLPVMTVAADATNSDMVRSVSDPSALIPVKAAPSSKSLWFLIQTLSAVTLTAQSKVTLTLSLMND